MEEAIEYLKERVEQLQKDADAFKGSKDLLHAQIAKDKLLQAVVLHDIVMALNMIRK